MASDAVLLILAVASWRTDRYAEVAFHVDAGGCWQAVLGACHRPWQRKRRIGKIDHGDAYRRRPASGRAARCHHRPRLPPTQLHALCGKSPRLGDPRRHGARSSPAFLRGARLRCAHRRDRGAGIRGLCRGGRRRRAKPRLRGHRYPRHRLLSRCGSRTPWPTR